MSDIAVTDAMRRAGIAAFRAWCQGDCPDDLGVYDFIYLAMERARMEGEQAARDARLSARDATSCDDVPPA